VVHRIKYSFSYFFLLVLFTHFILDIIKACCIKLKKTKSYFINITQSLVLPHSHRSRTRLLSHWTASVRCPLLTFSHLNLSPYNLSYLSPTVPEHIDRPSVTGAS
jgi:hypothetical protein